MTRTMLLGLALVTACGTNEPSVDPRAKQCSVFGDDHTGYTFDGTRCEFSTADIALPDELSVPRVLPGWDEDAIGGPGSASFGVSAVGDDRFETGAMRWAGDSNAYGVAVIVEPHDSGAPEQCVWVRCASQP